MFIASIFSFILLFSPSLPHLSPLTHYDTEAYAPSTLRLMSAAKVWRGILQKLPNTYYANAP